MALKLPMVADLSGLQDPVLLKAVLDRSVAWFPECIAPLGIYVGIHDLDRCGVSIISNEILGIYCTPFIGISM